MDFAVFAGNGRGTDSFDLDRRVFLSGLDLVLSVRAGKILESILVSYHMDGASRVEYELAWV